MNQSFLSIVLLLFFLAHQGNSQKITDNHSARIDSLFHYLDRIDSPDVAVGDRYVNSRMENLRLPQLLSYFEEMSRNLTEPAIPDEGMTNSLRIRRDLEKIVNTENPRNFLHVETLNTVAHYIKEEFQKSSRFLTRSVPSPALPRQKHETSNWAVDPTATWLVPYAKYGLADPGSPLTPSSSAHDCRCSACAMPQRYH